MSDMRVPLKEDEKYCISCDGFGGYPHNPETPLNKRTMGRCATCGGAGKYKKYSGDNNGDIWENWGRTTNYYSRER